MLDLMSIPIAFSRKQFPTDLTTVRFLSSMGSLMLFHTKAVPEGSVTITAIAVLRPEIARR